jgi:hypothetical protein
MPLSFADGNAVFPVGDGTHVLYLLRVDAGKCLLVCFQGGRVIGWRSEADWLDSGRCVNRCSTWNSVNVGVSVRAKPGSWWDSKCSTWNKRVAKSDLGPVPKWYASVKNRKSASGKR